MDKFGLLPSGSSIPFESHVERLDDERKELMLDLRSFTKSLGQSIIEEVRPHRVVYAKTLTFRTFLDVESAGDRLVVEIRSGRTEPPVRIEIRGRQELEEAKKKIVFAYEKIR